MRARTRDRRSRGEERRWWRGLLALIVAGLFPNLSAGTESPLVEHEETYTVSQLAVAGLVGSLRIERQEALQSAWSCAAPPPRSSAYSARSAATGCS